MGIEESFRSAVASAILALETGGDLPAGSSNAAFTVEKPKRDGQGDLAVNAALVLAKPAKKPPRDVAALLKTHLETLPEVKAIEIAGPGFLNVTLAPSAFFGPLREIAIAGEGYGRAASATGDRILLEFVSANPTGPLLVSHARGALVGDTVGRLLEATGNRVSREYYVNDFGNQVRIFAQSVASQAFGEPLPEDGYPGAYVSAVARDLQASEPELLEKYRASRDDDTLAALSRACVSRMMDGIPGDADLRGIRSTLKDLGIDYDAFFSEESLHRWYRVEPALRKLRERGYLHVLDDGAWVFRMPEGEGEPDAEHADGDKKTTGGRVVRKSDGKTFTYFASDIAYHSDKLARGYDRLITVLGADHHGYVARIRNVLLALGLPKEKFEVLLFQLVSLVRDGKPYKMGKRLGNLITVDEVLEEIDEALGKGAGADALRTFYLSRRTEVPVELDVELAKRASLDNPSLYLQYGHARLCSILRKASDEVGLGVPAIATVDLTKLEHPGELAILQLLGTYPRVLEDAARDLAPYRVLFYLQELSEAFHSYYTQTKKARDPVVPLASARAVEGWEKSWDKERTRARLLFIDAVRTVYASGLAILGIRAPERMTRAETTETENEEGSAS